MRRRIEAAIFVGPSLRLEDLARLPPAVEILPPAAQGDIYRLSLFRPKVVGLVDGFFHSVPAIWHKELLHTLAEGTLVFGAASMGALRAVELAPFGMRGIGEIFRQFQEGLLEDDDEVAVAHGPADLGYPPLSDAMVNLRATLLQALRQGIVSQKLHDTMLMHAKSRYFRQRSFANIYADAERGNQPVPLSVQHWISRNTIDLKLRDGRMLIDAMLDALGTATGEIIRAPHLTVEHTTMWDNVRRTHLALDDTPRVGVRELLEELALKGQEFARQAGVFPIDRTELESRDDHPSQDDDSWMRDFVGRLKRSGTYAELLNSAIHKKQKSQEYGALNPVDDREAIVRAHFERIGEIRFWLEPRSTALLNDGSFCQELNGYAQSLGLGGGGDFVRVLSRHHQLGLNHATSF